MTGQPRQMSSQPQAGTSFLAEASRLLAGSLDYETTLATVANLSLPYLGAWCIVDFCLDGEMRRAAIIHTDPGMQALARRLESSWPPERHDPFGVPRAARTRETEVVADVSYEMLVKVSRSQENLEILRKLGMGSLLVVPLLARGEVLGAITYVSPRGGRVHGRDDVALAEDLAARCAIALDNARLYRVAKEAANAAKNQFLAIMSHELLTPLSVVITHVEVLEAGVAGPTEAKEAYARIKENTWHLVSVIDEVLAFSRAEAGRLEVRREATDVVEIAREVTRIVGSDAERSGIALHFECEGAPPALVTDPGKVRWILLNLIGNAVKYSPQGEITVTVDCNSDSAGDFRIHVHDTGPGVAPGDQERIFEPFTQADSSNTRAAEGTGLGLSLARKLARLLGGDVTLQSAPGDGSTFTLQLPVVGEEEA